jgi:nucleotide sugar dehydrogenase
MVPSTPSMSNAPLAADFPSLRVPHMPDVAVIGMGYIGSVIAAVLAGRGFSVAGVDTNARMVAEVMAGRCPIPEPGLGELVARGVASGRLAASTDPAAARGARAVLITVGTPLSDDFTADLAHIRAACAGVAPYLHDGQIVMIKSTVPPGTTRAMHAEIIAPALPPGARVHMAFSPERLAEGAAIRELSQIPILVGGIDAAAGEAAAAFWREALPVEVMTVASPEAAEMVKLADNLWIDLNIALANELAKLVDAMPWKIDVMEVIRGANTLKKGQHHVNILHPANGVGGYCLTKDPWFVDALGRRAGIELQIPRASRAVNDSMPGHVFDRVTGALAARGIAPEDARIALLGFAFKSNSGDCRFTPVAPLVARLRASGCGLRVCDPMVTAAEAEHHGIALEPDWRRAVAGADAVLILAGHDAFTGITAEDFAALAPGALIYDGRIYYPPGKIAELEARGLAYMGVGR